MTPDIISTLTLMFGLVIVLPSEICLGMTHGKERIKHIIWTIVGHLIMFGPTTVFIILGEI